MKRTALALSLALLSGAAHASTFVMVNSHGGMPADFEQAFGRADRIIIGGAVCESACTLVLAQPRSKFCLHQTVALGFHSSWRYHGYEMVAKPVATAHVFRRYPASVQQWIAERGGLTSPLNLLVMRYPETANHARICDDTDRVTP